MCRPWCDRPCVVADDGGWGRTVPRAKLSTATTQAATTHKRAQRSGRRPPALVVAPAVAVVAVSCGGCTFSSGVRTPGDRGLRGERGDSRPHKESMSHVESADAAESSFDGCCSSCGEDIEPYRQDVTSGAYRPVGAGSDECAAERSVSLTDLCEITCLLRYASMHADDV